MELWPIFERSACPSRCGREAATAAPGYKFSWIDPRSRPEGRDHRIQEVEVAARAQQFKTRSTKPSSPRDRRTANVRHGRQKLIDKRAASSGYEEVRAADIGAAQGRQGGEGARAATKTRAPQEAKKTATARPVPSSGPRNRARDSHQHDLREIGSITLSSRQVRRRGIRRAALVETVRAHRALLGERLEVASRLDTAPCGRSETSASNRPARQTHTRERTREFDDGRRGMPLESSRCLRVSHHGHSDRILACSPR